LSDVVQDAGFAGAIDVTLTAANVADVAVSVSRRDAQFRQLGEDPRYVADNAASVAGTVRLERFFPDRWGIIAPLSVRYAATSSAPFYLAGTDLRADALTGLRTPRATAASYALTVRRSRFSAAPRPPAARRCGLCAGPAGLRRLDYHRPPHAARAAHIPGPGRRRGDATHHHDRGHRDASSGRVAASPRRGLDDVQLYARPQRPHARPRRRRHGWRVPSAGGVQQPASPRPGRRRGPQATRRQAVRRQR